MIRLILLLLFTVSISTAAQDISITIQPVSVVECVGNPVNIFINAESKVGNNLQYQWYKDGEKVSEAVSPVLKFTSLQHNQSGLYYCQVTSEGTSESVNSIIASVYALRPTSITLEPEDIKTNISSGSISLNFDAHINGFTIEEAIQKGENVKIQWYQVEGNINIPLEDNPIYNGTKTNKLNITFNNISDTTKYFASIEGKCGIVTTRIASVIKNFNELVLKLEDLDACEGIIYSLKAQITNPQNHKLEFQWYKNGQPIYYKENLKGIYSEELLFEHIYMKDTGNYKIEAKIKDINYKVFSNEVNVNVGKEPKIVCFRADTLRFDTDNYDKEQKRDIVTGWTKDVRLAIYYEFNNVPVQFDIYCNGNLISSTNSIESRWHLGNIYYLNFDVERNDDSKYWVIAHNKCGYSYSDTVNIILENNCDPYNQKQHLCEKDTMYFQIDYINRKENIKLDYFWQYFYEGGFEAEIKTPWVYDDSTLIREKNYLLHKDMQYVFMKNENFYELRHFIDREQIGLKIRNRDSTRGWESIFCCLDVYLELMPIIRREPVHRTVNNGDRDTLFNISFVNEEPFKMDIFFTIYFMQSLDSEPKEIYAGVPDYGLYYYYIKNCEMKDDGYYFALARHNNDCNPVSTDTIKVTVIPKGIVAGVNENSIESYFSIQPNPASEFINLKINNEASPIAAGKVQIFDILGMEVMSEVVSPMTGSHRMNLSGLPVGVYYIRIGDKVEKFVKM